MLDVLLPQLIHSMIRFLQMPDSVEQEETCVTVEGELSVYEGDMKPNNSV